VNINGELNKYEQLQRFFTPRSIAIVGASEDTTRIGGRPIAYSRQAGFTGEIYPVNPKYETVQGIPAYPSLRELPKPVDLAIMAVGHDHIIKAIEQSEGKVGGYVVFTAGYKETGTVGRESEQQLAQLVDASGSVILGPNCLGFVNVQTGVYATFSSGFEDIKKPSQGSVSIITQSGAFGAYLFRLATERDLGVVQWVSTGNESGLAVADVIDYCARDPETKVILAYLEGVKDGEAFRRALETVDQLGKTLIITKCGRTEAGAAAMRSHTGSMAGSDAVFDAVLRGHRAVRAESIREMLDLAEAAQLGQIPTGNRLGIVTMSGGAGILMADAALEASLEVPEMPQQVQEHILKRVPFASPRNPVDFTAQFINEPDLLGYSVLPMVQQTQLDAILVFLSHVMTAPSLVTPMLSALQEVRKTSGVPIFLSGLASDDVRSQLRNLHIPLFDDPVSTVKLISKLADLANPTSLNRRRVPPAQMITKPSGLLENDIKRWLSAHGLAVPVGRLADSEDDAVLIAEDLGYPVVLKLQSPSLQHKTDIGGVKVGLTEAGTVRSAVNELFRVAQQHNILHAKLLVEKMAASGMELLISVRRDPVFGAVLVYGLGGVMTEVFQDVRTVIIDTLDKEQVKCGLRSLKAAPILKGIRGQQAYDIDEIADFLCRIGFLGWELLQQTAFSELELNPVRVTPSGMTVLDAVIYT
jgi:acyl-CoA synthetase (NDP forming)